MCRAQQEQGIPTPHYQSLLAKARASLAAWDQFVTDNDLSSLRYNYSQWEKAVEP